MDPIKIRLAQVELLAVVTAMGLAEAACRRQIMVSTEDIILCENLPTWMKRLVSLEYSAGKKKENIFSMPVSLARILHTRFQQIPTTIGGQLVLQKLDQELVDRGWRPTQTVKIS